MNSTIMSTNQLKMAYVCVLSTPEVRVREFGSRVHHGGNDGPAAQREYSAMQAFTDILSNTIEEGNSGGVYIYAS